MSISETAESGIYSADSAVSASETVVGTVSSGSFSPSSLVIAVAYGPVSSQRSAECPGQIYALTSEVAAAGTAAIPGKSLFVVDALCLFFMHPCCLLCLALDL